MGLPVIRLTIRSASLAAERAETMLSLARGLMFRRHLAPDAGLLLCFPRSGNHGIHMWFVRIPLDVLFLSENGVVARIHCAQPGAFPFRPGTSIRYVLETNLGWCDRHGIIVGDRCQGLPAPR